MQNKLIIVLALLISACSTTDKPVVYETIKVNVPVPVECKTPMPEKPQYNFDQLSVDQTIYEKVRALLADRLLYLAYQAELEAALKSCK